MRVLVGRERPVGRRRAVGAARLPARLPEHLVAAEESQADAGVAGCLDVGALRSRPVLVVAAGHDQLVLAQQRAVGVGGDVGLAGVAGVVAVALDEPDQLVLGVVEVGAPAVLRDRAVKRPVVGHRERALVGSRVPRRARRRARVEAVAAVPVVRLPSRIGRPHQQLRRARVVAHNERDLARPAGVVAHQPSDVDARDRRRRNGPRRRHRPVAAVDQTRRGVRKARRLALRQRRAGHDAGGLQARAVALVVAEPVDVDVVRSSRRLDLEPDRAALVDAHRRRVALDRRVAGARHLPRARRASRLLVLARERVGARGEARPRANAEHHDRRRRKSEQESGTKHRLRPSSTQTRPA